MDLSYYISGPSIRSDMLVRVEPETAVTNITDTAMAGLTAATAVECARAC